MLICNHCGVEFAPSVGQVKRHRAGLSARPYCSSACMTAGQRGPRKDIPVRGPCPVCGQMFASRYAKVHCSMKCYISTPAFKARVAAMAPRGLAAALGRVPPPQTKYKCLHCEVEWLGKASSKRRFCSRDHYRAYMRDRFDRWIASPQSIALPQNYDEFLLQSELPCLVEGCGWVGASLSMHMNLAHGVPADEFKRAAGFNLSSGIVGAGYRTALQERPHLQFVTFGGHHYRYTGVNNPTGYKSHEAREHQSKARALNHAVGDFPKRVCRQCGVEFSQSSTYGLAKFCAIACREAWHKANRPACADRQCSGCGITFSANRPQQLRSARGLPVFCSFRCRGLANAHIRTRVR